MLENQYITLDSLVTRLSLPKAHLKELADAGHIPSLRVRGRLRFDERAVRASLGEIAKGKKRWVAYEDHLAAVQAERERIRREEVEPLRSACQDVIDGYGVIDVVHEAQKALAAVRAAQEVADRKTGD